MKLQIICKYPEANNKLSYTAENANVPLLHGIGKPPTSLQMRIVIRELSQTVLFHPPESLDLAPSHFHLLLPTQNAIQRHMFRYYNKVTEEVKKQLQQNPRVFSGCKRHTKKWKTRQKSGAVKNSIFPIS